MHLAHVLRLIHHFHEHLPFLFGKGHAEILARQAHMMRSASSGKGTAPSSKAQLLIRFLKEWNCSGVKFTTRLRCHSKIDLQPTQRLMKTLFLLLSVRIPHIELSFIYTSNTMRHERLPNQKERRCSLFVKQATALQPWRR